MPSSLIQRSFITLSLLGAIVGSAKADSFSALYVFGDSLSDAGNAYIADGGTLPGAPYSNGRFSNGNVWVQDMAASLGLPAAAKPSLLGGTDYAVGGATTANTGLGNLLAPAAQGGQIASFQAAHPVADPNALYMIWIGSNDIRNILAANNPATAAAAALAAVGNVDTAIQSLAGEGAKNFLILTAPDLGKTPAAIATGPAGVAASSTLSAFFDTSLVNGVGAAGIPSLAGIASADGLNLNVLDTYSLIDGITANPAPYGFTDVTDTCLTGSVNYSGGTPCANPNQYLFWDQIHPTAAGQALVAQAALQIVPEPSVLSMLFFGGLAVLGALALKNRRSDLLN